MQTIPFKKGVVYMHFVRFYRLLFGKSINLSPCVYYGAGTDLFLKLGMNGKHPLSKRTAGVICCLS